MPGGFHKCPYCGQGKILSTKGVSQHIAQSPKCKAQQIARLQGKDEGHLFAQDFMELSTVPRGQNAMLRMQLMKTIVHLG